MGRQKGMESMASYSVNEWGSHPDEGNDDCWTGEDFDTLSEAMAAFHAAPSQGRDTMYIELDGPGAHMVRRNPGYCQSRDDDTWQREHAMQCGMTFGCDGYNDAMGY